MKRPVSLQPHYIVEYDKIIENTEIVSSPETDVKLKYDEKKLPPVYIQLNDNGKDALRSMSLLFTEPKQNGRLQ